MFGNTFIRLLLFVSIFIGKKVEFLHTADLLGTIVDSSRHRHTLLDTALFESALLFGLTIAFGPLSKGHFNPGQNYLFRG